MSRVLITGAEGLVGSALVPHLLANGFELTTLTPAGFTPHDGVRVVRGDARDRAAVAEAVDGAQAVVHLAAIANAHHEPSVDLFGNNVLATFTVLWTAAEHGLRRFAIASSVHAAGLMMNPYSHVPPRYPVDETVPPDITDAYSLSKQTDENTLRAVCRRFGASGVAFRLPLMVSPANVVSGRAAKAAQADEAAADGWAWLDVRDGAEAFRLALTVGYEGAHVVQVAAPTVFDDRPTEELIGQFAPTAAREESYPGWTSPVDTRHAVELLGFVPRYAEPPEAGP